MATPFETIESAQQFVQLLAAEVAEVRIEIMADIAGASRAGASRRLDALQLVDYKLLRLAEHLAGSGRILNDLRMIRRLLVKEHPENINPRTEARLGGAPALQSTAEQ